MKKLLCLLLVAIMMVSTVSVVAAAEGEAQATIVVDGVKDAIYDKNNQHS